MGLAQKEGIVRNTLLLALAVGLLALPFLLLSGDLPDPDALISRSSPDTTKILDRQGRLLFEILDPRAGRRTRVSLNELPLHLRQAVIAVEDAGFYQHFGVDAVGVARAIVQAMQAGRVVSGGSTITMQLARDLLLSREERDSRSLARKLREMVLAIRLTQAYSKDLILESYLNEMYFGQLAYGVEAAAQAYFGKPARELDLAESALLAGLIQSPAEYDPLVHLDAAVERQRVVLGLMVKSGYLTQEQADVARAEPLHFAPQTTGPAILRAPHFVSYVRSLLEAEYGPERVNHGGLMVVTTLDLDLQQRAEAIVRQQLADLARRTEVVALQAGTLRIRVPDARWRNVLHRMRAQILAQLSTVAGDLAKMGYSVTIFEALHKTGGVLRYFDAASAPGNVFIDGCNMKIRQVLRGFDQTAIEQGLRALDGTGVPYEALVAAVIAEAIAVVD